MAAALAKVIRGGRSDACSQLPAIGRGILEEGVLCLWDRLGPPPLRACMGRLMHTGQWRNSGPLGGIGSKLAEQKALLFGTRRVLTPNQEPPRMALFSGKRFMSDDPFRSGPKDFQLSPLWSAYAVLLYFTISPAVSGIKKLLHGGDE